MFSGLLIVASIAGCKQWETFATWVFTFIVVPRGNSVRDLVFWMKGRMVGASAHICLGRENAAKGKKLGNLNGLKTRSFSSSFSILHAEWVFSDCTPCNWEVVFSILERFHSMSSMWQWGQMEYHPLRTLLFGDVDQCDMILNHQILQARSTDWIDPACYWVLMGKHRASKHNDISHSRGIGRGGSMVEIKAAC